MILDERAPFSAGKQYRDRQGAASAFEGGTVGVLGYRNSDKRQARVASERAATRELAHKRKAKAKKKQKKQKKQRKERKWSGDHRTSRAAPNANLRAVATDGIAAVPERLAAIVQNDQIRQILLAAAADVGERKEILAMVETLLAQAGAIESQIQTIEGEADEVEALADALEGQAENYEDAAAAIWDTIQAFREQAEQTVTSNDNQ